MTTPTAPQPRYGIGVTVPVEHAAAVTPADDADLPLWPTRGLYVGGTGTGESDIRVSLLGGDPVTLANLPDGTVLAMRVTRVYATGTTADSNIVALY